MVSGTEASDLIGRPPDRRKLIAVVYADMVGYSRLIGLDDAGTLERLRTLRRNLIDPAIDEHGGKIVQTGGDSLLIVFDSIDGAVRCAMQVQQRIPIHDGDQQPGQAIRFRVGINIGDAIADGTDLHGDAVNIAARLQGECPSGGVCITRAVRDHLRGRHDLAFEELGELNLKNIAYPVEGFVLQAQPSSTRPGRHSPTRLSRRTEKTKPSRLTVTVAPLRNLGLSEALRHLAECLTEDITTDLARHPGIFVVGFRKALLPSEDPASLNVARDLGVSYLVRGSIRGTLPKMNVNVQLIDVETGGHLWANRFDIDQNAISDNRNELSGRLVRSIAVELIEAADRHLKSFQSRDWTSSDLVMHGRALLNRPFSAANRYAAIKSFEEALKAEPDSIDAKIGIGYALTANIADSWSMSRRQDEARAEELLLDVMRTDANSAVAHARLGVLRRHQGRLDESQAELEIAIDLDPNNANSIRHLGLTLVYLGQPEVALPQFERSLRLAPHDAGTPIAYSSLARCYLLSGRVDEAITYLRKAQAGNRQLYYVHMLIAAALGLKGELDEAGVALQQAIEINPRIASTSGLRSLLVQYASHRFIQMWERTIHVGLRRAGLPE